MATPSKAAVFARQRGLYSEVLGDSSQIIQNSGLIPPVEQQQQLAASQSYSTDAFPSVKSYKMPRNIATKRAHMHPKAPLVTPNEPLPERPAPKLEPKVTVPHQSHSNAPPRRIEVERKKREFSEQSLDDLLAEQGVFYHKFGPQSDHQTGRQSHLALESFDDTEFESRESADWIARGTDDVSGQCKLAARALHSVDKSGRGTFRACVVTGVDTTTGMYHLTWCHSGLISQQSTLHRLHICFDAEDPRLFARRVGQAHTIRRLAEAELQYTRIIEHMPLADLPKMKGYELMSQRLLQLSLNTPVLKSVVRSPDYNSSGEVDPQPLLEQVGISMGRCVNKIIFDSTLGGPRARACQPPARRLLEHFAETSGTAVSLRSNHHSGVPLRTMLRFPKEIEENDMELIARSLLGLQPSKPAPLMGLLETPPHDFKRSFLDLHFHSFLARVEALRALTRVNEQCVIVRGYRLFNTHVRKAVSKDDFESSQQQRINDTSQFVCKRWIQQVTQAIRESLTGVSTAPAVLPISPSGKSTAQPPASPASRSQFSPLAVEVHKGWLNIAESSREVYVLSKLRKLMLLVALMMQDSLRYMVMDSVEAYAQLVAKFSRWEVVVEGTNEVSVQRIKTAAEKASDLALELAKEGAEEKKAEDERKASAQAHQEPDKKGKQKSKVEAQPEISLPVDPHFPLLRSLSDEPLFEVSLEITSEHQLRYSASSTTLIETVLKLFDAGVASVSKVQQVESLVMDKLFWGLSVQQLGTVNRLEGWVEKGYSKIMADLERSLAPMRVYLGHFARYADFLKLNTDEYLKEWSSPESPPDADEIKAEIASHFAAAEEVLNTVPKSMWLGMVRVDCSVVIDFDVAV
jgi:dynein heavy chain, axonemal